MFKNIDEDIRDLVKNLTYEETKEFFNSYPSINVVEEYPDAREELDYLFPNAIQLLMIKVWNDLKRNIKLLACFLTNLISPSGFFFISLETVKQFCII